MIVSTNEGGSMEWQAGTNTFRHFVAMSKYISSPYILACLSDDRKPAKDFASFNNNNLSYFIGLNSDETLPAMPLAGDRNLVTNSNPVNAGLVVITTNVALSFSSKMHNLAGNVGLADGSVEVVDNLGLQWVFQQSGTNVIRLAMP